MRIALLPSAYAPWVGGVEVLTDRLAHKLLERGDSVEVWTLRHPANLPELDVIDGIVVRRFSLPIPPAQPRAVLEFPAQAVSGMHALLAAHRQFHPDIMHVQCFSTNGIYALAVAGATCRPLVVTLQGETVMDANDIYDESAVLRLGLRAALRRADAVTACSAFVLTDAVKRFGLPPAKGRVIPNGVDTNHSDDTVPVHVPISRFVLGVGRVVAKKGFDLLIEAWALLAPEFTDVGLVIAGGGPQEGDLKRLAERRGVDNSVFFPGMLTQAEVRWLMKEAELFVLPSRVEPFGIVVLEAMQAGTPVIVSSHGGAMEIVVDGQGRVVDPFDTPALAASIRDLLDDRSVRDLLGAAGRQRAVAFDWDVISAEYRTVYRSVLAARRPRRRVREGLPR